MAFKMIDDNMDEGTNVTGGESFEEFASGLPDNAKSGFGKVPTEEGTDGVTVNEGAQVLEESPAKKTLKMSKKMKAAMKKIQDKVCSFPILYFEGKAKVHPEWSLDSDEKDIITESLSFVFEVLNINFNIDQLDVTLTSIWWVIAYPTLAIGMIFFSHKAAVDILHPKEEGNEDAK
jgi:hypothetical protein